MARDWYGKTPLHNAATCSNAYDYRPCKGFIKVLLGAGADGKVKDKKGDTPWDLAQENERLKGTEDYWALNDARYN
ncbi:MAG: hypothetical protein HOJ24_13355 [Rhodobacteraceae bacterium]|nr:hypothetical protein [Paracoccaceae bacterium]